VNDVLAATAAALDEGRVPARIFNDPQVHALELERLFARCWVFVGHESEIPSPGDYVQRNIGRDPFIFVRDEGGRIRVLFDGCRHRGALVCRSTKGNASHFRCSYHGWTYKNTGELIGAPSFKDAYGELDKSQWGLLPAPHVETLHGLVFASLDPDAPSLDEHLGDMRWYLDLLFGLAENGMEVLAEPHRWEMDADWKSGAENFAGDDYHTLYLHKSMFEIGGIQIPARANMFGYHIHAGNGHTLSCSIAPDPDDPGPKFWGAPDEAVRLFGTTRVTEEQFEFARRSRIAVGTIFPNLSLGFWPLTHDPKHVPPVTYVTLRQWQPCGPGRMEVWSWVLLWRGVSDAYRELAYRAATGTFSSSGTFEQDDAEPWQSIARTAGTTFARTAGLELNYLMGVNGYGISRRADDFPGPGVAYWPRYEEGGQRELYRRWLDFLTEPEYPLPRVSA
jgi:phenylpropionate dioxygenase-like ring-hydroxylating dioxygenase large terminal subunit